MTIKIKAVSAYRWG